jgi:hypothetical protein
MKSRAAAVDVFRSATDRPQCPSPRSGGRDHPYADGRLVGEASRRFPRRRRVRGRRLVARAGELALESDLKTLVNRAFSTPERSSGLMFHCCHLRAYGAGVKGK